MKHEWLGGARATVATTVANLPPGKSNIDGYTRGRSDLGNNCYQARADGGDL
jgi:hypothetical protein